ncbi:helix-turn-helix domain-containing protein [Herbaspirillum sp. 1130]|uniref:helix-turn-helix domain-containing protein n=1 Tax=Herbaspirillum sp. 1130 TaxID=2806562 RepID=UPI001AE5C8A3|nr:helix-turn-helix domain-containing protein [Herbaspirillum sp. 1130]MBP1318316.1 AraC-like DNA-binding protein [Herbaspirillum sp. 1130]
MHRNRKIHFWHSEQFHPDQKTAEWEKAVSQSYREWKITQSVPPSFHAHITRYILDDFNLINTICDPCHGERDHRTVKKDDDVYIGIQLTQGGHERFHSANHCVDVGPGDLMVWDTAHATRFEVLETLHKVTLMLPLRVLRRSFPDHRPPQGGKLNSKCGIGHLLAAQMRALVSEMNHLESHQVEAANRSLLELVSVALQQGTPEVPNKDAIQLQLLQQYIISHLHEEELGPRFIAEANGISIRKLHLIFQRKDLSVSSFILQKRLQICREMLMTPGFQHLQISEIAYGRGFSSTSHFSRAFKAAYGVTPTEFRQLMMSRRGTH